MANSSYNALYGNTFAVTHSILIDDTYTTPLPIVNVVNLLTSQSGSNGLPSSSQTSIGRVYGEAFSESGGRFTGTLETSSPITGSIQNFSSSLPWNAPGFSVRVAGDLGTAAGSLAVTQVNATQVRYTVPSSNGLEHTVSLYVPSANYSAWYTIQTRLGSAATQEFRLNSSVGPATFETNGTGTLTVTVILDNWTAIQTNNSVTLELNAYLEDGFPVSGEMAQIDFAASYPIHSVILGPTDNSGGAVYYSLPPGPSVTGVTLIGGSYSLHSYSVTNPQSRVVQVSVVLVPGPPGSGNQSGTGSTVVRFTEHGLSPGTTWWVSVTGPVSENLSSSESTISFTLVNGTYLYTFGISSEPSAAEPQYMLVVPYTSTNLTVDFTGEAGATSASRLPLLSLGEAVGLGVAAIGLAGALVTGTRRRVWRVPIRGAAQWLIRLRRR